MKSPTTRRASPLFNRFRARIVVAVTLSLLIHGIILSLQFGVPGLGLPGLELPWNERSAPTLELNLRLANVKTAPEKPEETGIEQSTPKRLYPAEQTPSGARFPTAASTHAQVQLPSASRTPPLALADEHPKSVGTDGKADSEAETPPLVRQVPPQPEFHPEVITRARKTQDNFAVPSPSEGVPDKQNMPPPETPPPPPEAAEPSTPEPEVLPEEIPVAPPQEQAEAERKLAEQEAARHAQEVKKQEEVLAKRQAAELEARKQAEENARQQAQAAQKSAEEAARRAQEQEARKQEEALAQRQAAELEARKQAEENAKRQAAALALKQQEQQAQAAQKLAEEEAARRALQLEKKKQEEALAKRQALELEARKQAEEADRRQAAELARQKQAEELAARREAEAAAAAATAKQRERERIANERAPVAAPRATASTQAADAAGSTSKNLVGGDLATRMRELAKSSDLLRSEPIARAPGSKAEEPRRPTVFGGIETDIGLKMYVEGWRQKIERNGSLNYKQSSKERARADPVIRVVIRSDGSVEDIVVIQSSGRPELDEAVRRIVRLNAPYGAFPPDLALSRNVIEIRRIWSFDDRLRLLEEVR